MKRYYPRGGNKLADMSNAMNGEWVKYEDHTEAMKALREELDRWKIIAQNEASENEETRIAAEELIAKLTTERDHLRENLRGARFNERSADESAARAYAFAKDAVLREETAEVRGLENAAAICENKATEYRKQAACVGLTVKEQDHQKYMAFAADQCATRINTAIQVKKRAA